MPKASVDPTQTERFNLITCPGGYVILRTLSFHEMEVRKDIAGRMYQEQKVSGRKNDDDTMRAYFESMNVKVTEYEFRNMIVEHNLYMDDAETQLIDFTKPMHHWMLAPKIGEEISKYVESLTQMDEDDVAPLTRLPSSSSQGEKDKLSLFTEPS